MIIKKVTKENVTKENVTCFLYFSSKIQFKKHNKYLISNQHKQVLAFNEVVGRIKYPKRFFFYLLLRMLLLVVWMVKVCSGSKI